MGHILIIAEKPSVGRDIGRVLGCRKRGEGCLIGERYIVTWAIGHLITLAEPEDYDEKYKKWASDTLPIIPETMKLKPNTKTRKQYGIVKKLMNDKDVDSIICATDSGREGELIFRYIYQSARCRKPFQRLWISSMTDTAIKEGFANLKPGSAYDLLYESARCRSEADWLVGINASRAFTIQYNALLSIGRVQTPTLSIIIDKQKEIDHFMPQDYWEVQGDFGDFQGTWFDLEKEDTRINDYEKAKAVVKRVKGQSGKITKIEQEEKRQVPPLLYDLTELQREGNRKFGFSAKKTLSIAQDLYEKRKLITYPRTDSRYLSEDMIPKLKGILSKLDFEPYREYVGKLGKSTRLPITKRIINNDKVTDHHAIIPTEKQSKFDQLSQDEQRIYDLIIRRFLAVFYPNFITLHRKVMTEVKGETFISKGKTILQLGWMELYQDSRKEDEEQELPPLKEGDTRILQDVDIQKKQTQPPRPYTEATLLSAMENAGRFIEDEELKEQLKDSGLGTPATRAAIIERLLQVGYIKRRGKVLYPTEKGMNLIKIVPNELKSPETTGKWEKGLSSISKGQMSPERFLESIKRYVYFIIEASAAEKEQVHFQQEKGKRSGAKKKVNSLGQCPACEKGKILENRKGFYCSRWKQGCTFTIWKNNLKSYGIDITLPMAQELVAHQKVDDVELVHPQTGKKEKACIHLIDKKGTLSVDF